MRICTLLFLALQAPPAPPAKPDSGVAVTLSDGSTLISSGVDDALEIRTPYGDQKIPIRDIRSARRLPHGSFVVHARGLSVTGDVVPKEIEIRTSVGPFRVPTDDLRALTASCGGRNLADDATIALWWFADSSDGSCSDRVKGRSFGVQEFEPSGDPTAIPALTRKKFNSSAVAECDDDLDLLEEDYTIEIRFRLPAQIQRPVMILQKASPADGSQDFNLCSPGNHGLQVYSAASGQNCGTPPNILKMDGWNTVAIVQKKATCQTQLYVNGKSVLTLQTLMQFGTGMRRAIQLGAHPRFASGYESPEAIQCLRFSRTARSAEELVSMERGWEFAAAGIPIARGAVLRDGSCLKADLPGVPGAVFRTRFGALTLADKVGAQIRLYPLRPKELDVVRAAARDLIAQLGSGRGEDRDAASTKLASLGEAAIPSLRESESAGDAETRGRIAAILKTMSDTGVLKRPACDVLVQGDLVIHGWLEMDEIAVATRRGTHRLSPSQVESIILGRRESKGKPTLHLLTGEVVEFNPAEGAAATVETEFGSMAVPLEELRTLSFDGEKKKWHLTAERLTATGRISGTAAFPTSFGTLSLPLSEVRDLRHPGKGVPKPSGDDD